MDIRILSSAKDLQVYAQWVKNHPHGSLWQSLERKNYLEACGKKVVIYTVPDQEKIIASALVVIDRTFGGLSTWDIPRGPLGPQIDNSKLIIEKMMETILGDAQNDRSMSLFFSPQSKIILNSQFSILNSPRLIHAEASRILDLTQTEDQILSQMEPKGRYNIKVAQKHGITVEQSNDVDAFYELLKGTGGRDGFVINSKAHYSRFLSELEGSFLLIAMHDKKPIAGLIGVTWNGAGYYYYGASDYAHRNLMAPYLVQWEGMKLCKGKGCTTYDLLGIAPTGAADDHPWAGITGFKARFGGTVIEYPPEQEIVLRPVVRGLLQWKRRVIG